MNLRTKELRQQRGLSQWDLAKALDVHPQTVTGWETGKVLPRGKHLEALAGFFGVEVGDLFCQQSA